MADHLGILKVAVFLHERDTKTRRFDSAGYTRESVEQEISLRRDRIFNCAGK